jgi:hypothetical protein
MTPGPTNRLDVSLLHSGTVSPLNRGLFNGVVKMAKKSLMGRISNWIWTILFIGIALGVTYLLSFNPTKGVF